ncbi:hypothetical protein VPMS16_1667 [Vibrio sp. 16]|nr:hypothetical protein VPMS16_1667 [Vibrio sp. 16]
MKHAFFTKTLPLCYLCTPLFVKKMFCFPPAAFLMLAV